MSGRALNRMRQVLNATGAYALTEENTDWELTACGAGFDLLEKEAAALLPELFFATASKETLDRWEALFRPQASGASLEERRETAAARMRLNAERHGAEALPDTVRAAGMKGAALEAPGALRLFLVCGSGLPEEEVARELEELLPAHLDLLWEDELVWAALDAVAPSFSEIDQRQLTWQQLDGLTKEQIRQWSGGGD